MRRILVLAIVLLVLASAANATPDLNWSGNLAKQGSAGLGSVDVDVTALWSGTDWAWSYTVNPVDGAKDLSAFTLNVGVDALTPVMGANITNIASSGGALGWASSIATGNSIQWTMANGTAALNNGVPGVFTFNSAWGPSTMNLAKAQDGGQYAANVPTPTIPEPMSVMLGFMGLSSIAGLRRLRKK